MGYPTVKTACSCVHYLDNADAKVQKSHIHIFNDSSRDDPANLCMVCIRLKSTDSGPSFLLLTVWTHLHSVSHSELGKEAILTNWYTVS